MIIVHSHFAVSQFADKKTGFNNLKKKSHFVDNENTSIVSNLYTCIHFMVKNLIRRVLLRGNFIDFFLYRLILTTKNVRVNTISSKSISVIFT